MPAPEKQKLRRELKRRLGAQPPEFFRVRGEKAARLLQTLPLWHTCHTVLIFLSTDSEIDTGPLLEAAHAGGKQLFAPKIQAGRLRFWRVSSPAGPWEPGSFGIREPAAAPGGALTEADFPALIITPGLGFDRQGGRLGRGGGFYDRFFAEEPGSLPFFALGFCTAPQLVDTVPMEGGDRRMDAVCTDEGIWPCSSTYPRNSQRKRRRF